MASQQDRDKPIVNLTFSKLDAEETPQPFVYMTKANKRVTFPDLFGMEAEEGEKFLREMAEQDDEVTLKKWLSDEDYEAYREDRLTLRQRMRLIQTVTSYYEGSFGTEGEGQASES